MIRCSHSPTDYPVQYRAAAPPRCNHSRTSVARNSGPLSDRRYCGTARSTNRRVRISQTSGLSKRRATTMAKHSRVTSSILSSLPAAAASRAVAPTLGTPDVPRPAHGRGSHGPAPPCAGASSSLGVSLVGFLQNRVIQRQGNFA